MLQAHAWRSATSCSLHLANCIKYLTCQSGILKDDLRLLKEFNVREKREGKYTGTAVATVTIDSIRFYKLVYYLEQTF